MNESKAFQAFSEAVGGIMNPEVEKWKGQGGRAVGYFCSTMPVEVITAAGLLPFRLRATGSTGTELSDAFFSSLNCSFPRHAFNMALKGEYDFLDGLVMFNSCDHIRRVYDHWTRQLKTPFVRILSLPKKAGELQVEWFRSELAVLKEDMQEFYKVEITDEELNRAIKLHNETRRLLRSMYELRKNEEPAVTGAEALTVTAAGAAMPVETYKHLLEEFMNDISKRSGHTGHRARLMLLGGELDNPEFVRVIEEQGGLVVTDSLCFGSRVFWEEVEEDSDDPLTALARYYVAERPPCARVFTEYDKRIDYIRKMLKDFNVDGAIFERLVFCEMWGFEQYSLVNDFKEWDFPLLCIDREYILSGTGQVKTRVQAFLEKMGR